MVEKEKSHIWDIMAHYEGMADKSKSRAWSLTTWILTLNSGLFAFGIKFYSENQKDPNFLMIELACCGIGILLCLFLSYVLYEQGRHLRGYWQVTDRILSKHTWLSETTGIEPEGKPIAFPRFCIWLILLSCLFIVGFLFMGVFYFTT